MYKRDFGILFIAAFAVLLNFQSTEGPFTFRKAWYHNVQRDDTVLGGIEQLAVPLVADLNGDGAPEVLIATQNAKVQVLQPRPPGRAGEGFAEARVLAEVSLLPGQIRVAAGRRAIAMATGYLDPPGHGEMVLLKRKQVVAVVTSGWHLMVFDHNLALLWERNIKDHFPAHASIHEVAVSISHHRVGDGDRGMIVVGGSVRRGDISATTEETLEDVAAQERDEADHEAGVGPGGVADVTADEPTGQADVSRHFSYYCYEGGGGAPRWSHEGTDYHRDVAQLKEVLIPQHNYRLDVASLEGRHFGEVSCREYQHAILHVLPHRWSSRADTRLHLATFHKQRTPSHPGRDSGAAGHSAHVRHDGAGGGHAHDHERAPPNVLVAHLEEGIEVVHLYTGRSLCKLHLPPGGLHADFNGDGVLDHAAAVGGEFEDVVVDQGHQEHSFCWATVTSGVPPTTPLFEGSICRTASRLTNQFASRSFGRNEEGEVAVVPPMMLPRPVVPGQHLVRGQRGDVVFMNSRGEVTAYDAAGSKLFQVQAGTSWPPSGDTHGDVVPTLRPLPLRRGGEAAVILAAGATQAVVLSEHAAKLDKILLPAPPVAPLQVRDFSGSGLNDLILMTEHGAFGYAQVRRPGGVGFGALIACLLAAMALVYFLAQSQADPAARRLRSTDRTD